MPHAAKYHADVRSGGPRTPLPVYGQGWANRGSESIAAADLEETSSAGATAGALPERDGKPKEHSDAVSGGRIRMVAD
jgi:hypothetical protein